jgi:hypothetical protein
MKDIFNLQGKYRIITTDSKTGKEIRKTPFYKNIVVDGTNTGFNLILKRLYGTNTYSLNINYLDIGDDNTTPTTADTLLGNAVARASIATKSIDTTSITYRFFFPDIDLPNGDYEEVGLFIDGTSSIDTGQMFTHSLFDSTYTKATGEDTTIEYILSKN